MILTNLQVSLEQCFYGSATLGERGQVVIPAEARRDCEFHPGDKLLVFRHPMQPEMLILAKVGTMQEMVKQITDALTLLQQQVTESSSEH